ncbi:PTS sugar transporter subunit IIB [Weissella diestrammenae]|uniref:PTS sugar transporter subunit IIB n=1 Tax=Weissella diestrammenae TaxID=1162633 RepID=A0A7G9T4S8_9LACO|nr:PTS sugar transporter subunit IIB [Weissella diestrammenae]MCM0582815.1 PTS sugar transporter subunit IIB [Weissella diestrammenae]QNN75103.1 PTS sugar transporter subunit IIB [Weissella diestrammenae]
MAEKIIMLACSAGMSTSMLVQRMEEAAKENGKDYEIFAKSTSDIDDQIANHKPDVLLLGPQVGYMKDEIKAKTDAAGIPMDVINMMDYGMMKGANVLQAAEKLMV